MDDLEISTFKHGSPEPPTELGDQCFVKGVYFTRSLGNLGGTTHGFSADFKLFLRFWEAKVS